MWQILEKDIEGYLENNPQALEIERWLGRQVDVPSGIIDLLGTRRTHGLLNLVVVEVKRTTVNQEALTQIARYAKDMEEIVKKLDYGYFYGVDVEKIIVSSDYEKIDKKMFIEAKTLDIEIRGCKIESVTFDIRGKWQWSEEYELLLDQQYEKLGSSQMFDIFRSEFEELINEGEKNE